MTTTPTDNRFLACPEFIGEGEITEEDRKQIAHYWAIAEKRRQELIK